MKRQNGSGKSKLFLGTSNVWSKSITSTHRGIDYKTGAVPVGSYLGTFLSGGKLAEETLRRNEEENEEIHKM